MMYRVPSSQQEQATAAVKLLENAHARQRPVDALPKDSAFVMHLLLPGIEERLRTPVTTRIRNGNQLTIRSVILLCLSRLQKKEVGQHLLVMIVGVMV
jgi:hypothetical protein